MASLLLDELDPGECMYVDSDSDTESVCSTASSSAGGESSARLHVGWKPPNNVSQKQIRSHFESHGFGGYVTNIRVFYDKATRKPKGFAIVTISPSIIAGDIIQKLNGSLLLNNKITVKLQQHKQRTRKGKKERQASQKHPNNEARTKGQASRGRPSLTTPTSPSADTGSTASSSGECCRLYVGSKLPPFINEGHLREHFRDFETYITKIEIIRDKATTESKGFGFVSFVSQEVALLAISRLNHSKLLGKYQVKVDQDKSTHSTSHPQSLPDRTASAQPRRYQRSSYPSPSPDPTSPGTANVGHLPSQYSEACDQSTTVTIKGLSSHITEDELRAMIGPVITSCKIQEIAPNEKVATIEFQSSAEASKVVADLDGKSFIGQTVHASLVPTQHSCSSTFTVKVTHLPPTVTEEKLLWHFQSAGEISNCKIHRSKSTYAHVNFTQLAGAKTAVKSLDKSFLDGMKINVSFQNKSSSGPKPQMVSVKVSNLPANITPQNLEDVFSQYGVESRLTKIISSNPPHAFVNFPTMDLATQAQKVLSNTRLYGQEVQITIQSASREIPPTAHASDRTQQTPGSRPPTRPSPGVSLQTIPLNQGQVPHPPQYQGPPPPAYHPPPPYHHHPPPNPPPPHHHHPPPNPPPPPHPPPHHPHHPPPNPPPHHHPHHPPPNPPSPPRPHLPPYHQDQMSPPPHHHGTMPPQSQAPYSPPGHHSSEPQRSGLPPDSPVKVEIMKLEPDQWNHLTTVNRHGTSLFQQLIEPYAHNPNVEVELVMKDVSVHFSGTSAAAVSGAYQHILGQLNKDLHIPDRQKMQALIAVFPHLPEEINRRHDITVSGYQDGSSIIHLEGLPQSVASARKEITKLLQQYQATEVDLPIPIELVSAAREKLQCEGIQVHLQPPVPPSTKCTLCSFAKQHYKRAIGILPNLAQQLTTQVSPFPCTLEEARYINHVFLQPPEDEKAFVHSLPAKVEFSKDAKEVLLCGSSESIQAAMEQIRGHLLAGLKCCVFEFNSNFKYLIEQHILKPYMGRSDFLCLPNNRALTRWESRRASQSDKEHSATFSFTVYTKEPTLFTEVCEALESLSPGTRRIQLKPIVVQYALQFAKKLENKHRLKVHHTKAALIIHGLVLEEVEDSCELIKAHVSKTFVDTQHLSIDFWQAKYLLSQQELLDELKAGCEELGLPPMKGWNAEGDPRSVRIKGTIQQIENIKEKIEEKMEGFTREEFVVMCDSKLLKQWKKRWIDVKNEQKSERNSEVIVNFEFKPSSDATTSVSFTVFGSDHEGVKEVRELILNRENGQMVEQKEISLSEKAVIALLSGLKRKELDPEGKHIVKMDITRADRKVTLTSPAGAIDDLEAAEEMISKYLGIRTVMGRNIECANPVVGLVLAQSSKHLHAANQIAREHHVSVQLLKKPRCGFSLRGSQEGLEKVAPLIHAQVVDVIEVNIGKVQITVQPIYAPVFSTHDFSRFNTSELQEKLCIVGSFPIKSTAKQLRKALIQPSATAHCLTLEICKGNLVYEQVDVIVNAANEDLKHIGGLAKAILDAGGNSIQVESDQYRKQSGRLKAGDVICLGAGELPCKRLIHAVGPRWKEGRATEEQTLYFTVYNALCVANKEELGSIAFPAIGTGVFGIPEDVCARASLKAVRDFCQANPTANVHTVKFVLFVQGSVNAFTTAFDSSGILDSCRAGVSSATEQISTTSPTATSLAPSYQWLWENDAGSFSPFDATNCANLTKVFLLDSKGSVSCTIGKHTYTIDFSNMVQTNTSTGYQRGVKYTSSPSSSTVSHSAEWYYTDDKGKMTPYQTSQSKAIETMYLANQPQPLVIGGKTYTFDFQRMCQINTSTNYKRAIQRQEKKQSDDPPSPSSLAIAATPSAADDGELDQPQEDITVTLRGPKENLNIGEAKLRAKLKSSLRVNRYPLPQKLPAAMEKKLQEVARKHGVKCTIQELPGSKLQKQLLLEGLTASVQRATTTIQQEIIEHQSSTEESTIEVPAEWQEQTATTQVFSVAQGTPEWRKVEARFRETMASNVIHEIQRIQNEWLWQKYIHHKRMLDLKNNGQVNEKELFHGTRSNDPRTIYEGEEGFDMRFSASGMWGQANYFAVNANYSHGYAHSASDGRREMFLVRVLTGDSHECSSNSSLRKPPVKQGGASGSSKVQLGQMNYDTVTGYTGGSRVYMAYDNLKAYPAYLIRYN